MSGFLLANHRSRITASLPWSATHSSAIDRLSTWQIATASAATASRITIPEWYDGPAPPDKPLTGSAVDSHIRSTDTEARPIHCAGATVPPDVARLVRAKLDSIVTI